MVLFYFLGLFYFNNIAYMTTKTTEIAVRIYTKLFTAIKSQHLTVSYHTEGTE